MKPIQEFRVLELFAGTRSIGKAFQRAGVPRTNIISIEINTAHKDIDIYGDVYSYLDLDFLKSFDFIWASPDCTTYSYASTTVIHRDRVFYTPLSKYALYCDHNNAKLFKALMDSNVPFMIENPHAMMRYMGFVQNCLENGMSVNTFYYGGFDAKLYKPTNIFSNINLFFLAAVAPVGTKKAISQIKCKNKVDRSVIPGAFCDFLVDFVLKQEFVFNQKKFEQFSIFDFL